MRKCGDDFVRRKDAFLVAFDRQCKREGADLEAVTTCGQALKDQYGFPDETCPDESPLSEIGNASLEPPPAPAEPPVIALPDAPVASHEAGT
jgi:hypothetical protein